MASRPSLGASTAQRYAPFHDDDFALNRPPLHVDALALPSGACGYRDLTVGAHAPTCGCRRFWPSTIHFAPQAADQREWCFCGHHACFHEGAPLQGGVARPQLGVVEEVGMFGEGAAMEEVALVGAKEDGMGLGDLGVVQSREQSRGLGTGYMSAVGQGSRPSSRAASGLGIQGVLPAPPEQMVGKSQSINTRVWQALNEYARAQEEQPPLQQGGSRLPSTAEPSLMNESLRRDRTTGSLRNTLLWQQQQQQQQQHPMGPPSTSHPHVRAQETQFEDHSATEVATPSVRGTPDLGSTNLAPTQFTRHQHPLGVQAPQDPRQEPGDQSVQIAHQSVARQARSATSIDSRGSTRLPDLSLQEIRNTIQNYGHRISLLEGISFSHMPSDEVVEKFDLVDGRLLDLEQWRRDSDRPADSESPEPDAYADMEMTRGSRRERGQGRGNSRGRWSAATQSRLPSIERSPSRSSSGSFDSNAAAHTEAVVLATLAATADTGPRFAALESRVAALEGNAAPSFSHPWRVQVVLLPYGRDLPGIWFSSSESSTQHSQSMLRRTSATQLSEEWEAAASSSGAAGTVAQNLSFQSAASGAWTTESIEAWASETQHAWLSPKACGPSGTVFQRLESRGCVRDVVLTAADARHISSAIANAMRHMTNHESTDLSPDVKSRRSVKEQAFRGLCEPFIPLRKVRKSTRLRFLSPAEMVTPAVWTAQFLDASVFMKVHDGQRRLYVTTPEAYIQPSDAENVAVREGLGSRGWSWKMLRNLPAVLADGEFQAAQTSHDMIEACWTYNERLDCATSALSSFDADSSPWAFHSEPRDSDAEPDENQDTDRAMEQADTQHTHAHSSPSKAHQRSRSRAVRSLSLPRTEHNDTANPIQPPTSSSFAGPSHRKSRLPSLDAIPQHPSPRLHTGPDLPFPIKRRRTSSSPDIERRGVNFTPRWSREPPSPFTHLDDLLGADIEGNISHRTNASARPLPPSTRHARAPSSSMNDASSSTAAPRRGITPSAYATPHSHNDFPRHSDSDEHHHALAVDEIAPGRRSLGSNTPHPRLSISIAQPMGGRVSFPPWSPDGMLREDTEVDFFMRDTATEVHSAEDVEEWEGVRDEVDGRQGREEEGDDDDDGDDDDGDDDDEDDGDDDDDIPL